MTCHNTFQHKSLGQRETSPMVVDLRERFNRAVGQFSERVAIQFKRGTTWHEITYLELEMRVKTLASWMLKEGVEKSDRVAVMLGNSPEWATVFFAIMQIGAVSVPISTKATEEEVKNIVEDSGSKLVFIEEGLSVLDSPFLRDSRHIEEVIRVDISGAAQKADFEKILEQNADRSEERPWPEIAPDDLASIIYTSGTTSEPKGVMLTHRNLSSNSNSVLKTRLIQSSDSILSILPLHHTYSLQVTLLSLIFIGAKVVYPASLRPEDLVEAMQCTKTTVLIGVPELFYGFHRKIFEKLNAISLLPKLILKFLIETLWIVRKSIRLNVAPVLFHKLHRTFGNKMNFFTSGGAKLNEDAARDFFKLGFTILEGYGLTETSPVLTMNPLARPKIGSVGLPVPGVEIRIQNPDAYGIGEVIAKGENVMKGYYKKEAQTSLCIKDGWFYTGDLGYRDKDGYLFLTGRSKEVIVLSSGVNIYPEEIETHYSKNNFVKEICVINVKLSSQPGSPEALFAIVVPELEEFRKWNETNLQSVIKGRLENLSRKLPSHKRIMGFLITLEPLPRTVLGKIKRYKVRQIFLPQIEIGESASVESYAPSKEDQGLLESETANDILKLLEKKYSLKRPARLEDSLELDLGIDSLGRVELVSDIEKKFNVSVPDEVMGRVFTVRDVIVELDSRLSEGRRKMPAPEGGYLWKDILSERPDGLTIKRMELAPNWYARLWTYTISTFLRAFFYLFYRFKIRGKENLPRQGPYILCVNHTSYFDAFIVASSIPESCKAHLFFIGYRGYFEVPVIRKHIKLMRIIPIDLASHMLDAMRAASYVLRNRKILCMFPEGERSFEGTLQEFKKGIGILAKELDVRLVPVFIRGAYEIWPRAQAFPKMTCPFGLVAPGKRPLKIEIRFGKPLEPEKLREIGRSHGAEDDYQAIAIGLKEEFTKLMDG